MLSLSLAPTAWRVEERAESTQGPLTTSDITTDPVAALQTGRIVYRTFTPCRLGRWEKKTKEDISGIFTAGDVRINKSGGENSV